LKKIIKLDIIILCPILLKIIRRKIMNKNNEKKKTKIMSILNPENTFFKFLLPNHKGSKHIGTLELSDKDGKLGISLKFEDTDKK
jgi:hypothetical protein